MFEVGVLPWMEAVSDICFPWTACSAGRGRVIGSRERRCVLQRYCRPLAVDLVGVRRGGRGIRVGCGYRCSQGRSSGAPSSVAMVIWYWGRMWKHMMCGMAAHICSTLSYHSHAQCSRHMRCMFEGWCSSVGVSSGCHRRTRGRWCTGLGWTVCRVRWVRCSHVHHQSIAVGSVLQ